MQLSGPLCQEAGCNAHDVRGSVSRLLPYPPKYKYKIPPPRANCVESFGEAGGLVGL